MTPGVALTVAQVKHDGWDNSVSSVVGIDDMVAQSPKCLKRRRFLASPSESMPNHPATDTDFVSLSKTVANIADSVISSKAIVAPAVVEKNNEVNRVGESLISSSHDCAPGCENHGTDQDTEASNEECGGNLEGRVEQVFASSARTKTVFSAVEQNGKAGEVGGSSTIGDLEVATNEALRVTTSLGITHSSWDISANETRLNENLTRVKAESGQVKKANPVATLGDTVVRQSFNLLQSKTTDVASQIVSSVKDALGAVEALANSEEDEEVNESDLSDDDDEDDAVEILEALVALVGANVHQLRQERSMCSALMREDDERYSGFQQAR